MDEPRVKVHSKRDKGIQTPPAQLLLNQVEDSLPALKILYFQNDFLPMLSLCTQHWLFPNITQITFILERESTDYTQQGTAGMGMGSQRADGRA